MAGTYVRTFGGVIWTNHALDRLKKRKIFQYEAIQVLRNPDKSIPGKKPGSVKFVKDLRGRNVQAVAFLNEEKKWVVMSVWVRGEEDKLPWEQRLVGGVVDWVARKIKKRVVKKKTKMGKQKKWRNRGGDEF